MDVVYVSFGTVALVFGASHFTAPNIIYRGTRLPSWLIKTNGVFLILYGLGSYIVVFI